MRSQARNHKNTRRNLQRDLHEKLLKNNTKSPRKSHPTRSHRSTKKSILRKLQEKLPTLRSITSSQRRIKSTVPKKRKVNRVNKVNVVRR